MFPSLSGLLDRCPHRPQKFSLFIIVLNIQVVSIWCSNKTYSPGEKFLFEGAATNAEVGG